MTKAQARAWKARWRVANALHLEYAKRRTPDEKFEGLVQLMHFALQFPDTAYRRRDARQAARRWARFREVYGDCRAIRSA